MLIWCPDFTLCRSGPPCRPTINHRKPDVTGGADVLWDVDSSLLSNSAPLLGGGTTRAAAAAPPAAPSPAAPRRCRPTHSDLEASKRQVASCSFTNTIKQIWIHVLLWKYYDDHRIKEVAQCCTRPGVQNSIIYYVSTLLHKFECFPFSKHLNQI